MVVRARGRLKSVDLKNLGANLVSLEVLKGRGVPEVGTLKLNNHLSDTKIRNACLENPYEKSHFL